MPSELYTFKGKRKYLTVQEQQDFLAAASELERGDIRTLCMTLTYTGARISEALAISPDNIDLSAKTITLRTLKQRDKERYRDIPVPDDLLNALELVHGIRKLKKSRSGGKTAPLWKFQRAMAGRHVSRVMTTAKIEGVHACPKGLRHAFGILMAQTTRNPRLVQKLMGHTSLETTAHYLDLVGDEARAEVMAAWKK